MKIVASLLPLFLALFAGACSASPEEVSANERERLLNGDLVGDQVVAKSNLDASLKDADSAKYRDVAAHRYQDTVGAIHYTFCGQVNAKNTFGGFTGFHRFVASIGAVAVDDGGSGFKDIWKEYCSGIPERSNIWL